MIFFSSSFGSVVCPSANGFKVFRFLFFFLSAYLIFTVLSSVFVYLVFFGLFLFHTKRTLYCFSHVSKSINVHSVFRYFLLISTTYVRLKATMSEIFYWTELENTHYNKRQQSYIAVVAVAATIAATTVFQDCPCICAQMCTFGRIAIFESHAFAHTYINVYWT